MKKILVLLLFVSFYFTTSAKDFYKASVYYHNGTEKEGLVSYVVAESGEYVYFKQSEKTDVEKIESSLVKKVIYTLDDTNYENPVNGFLPDISRKSVVKAMKIHLSEYPELIEKVRTKEIDKMNLAEIFTIYNNFMSQK